MSDARIEIKEAVGRALANLKPIAERNPAAPVSGDDFNMLLDRAKEVFPHSAAIQGIKRVESSANMGELMLKLSILEGAVTADFIARAHAA